MNYRKRAIQNMFEYLEQDLLIRVESVHMDLDNLKDRLDKAIDRGAGQFANEIKFISDQKTNFDHNNSPNPATSTSADKNKKMSQLLGDLQNCWKKLRKSELTATEIILKLTDYRASSRPLHRDKSAWLGKLTCTLKPLILEDVVDSRVKFVNLFGYTTNLTSVCSLDNDDQDNNKDNILVLDNYLNSVSLFDKHFNLIKTVWLNELGNVREARLTFNSNLYGVVASSRYVYVNNCDCNQIIVLDRALTGLKSIFSPLKSKSIFEVDTCADFVFVFDNQNREVLR